MDRQSRENTDWRARTADQNVTRTRRYGSGHRGRTPPIWATSPQEGVRMEYTEFLATLDPVIVGLDNSSCALNRDAYWSPSQNARQVLSSKYALADVADDYFDVLATFSLSLQWSDADGPVVQALKIECTFIGHLHAGGAVAGDQGD